MPSIPRTPKHIVYTCPIYIIWWVPYCSHGNLSMANWWCGGSQRHSKPSASPIAGRPFPGPKNGGDQSQTGMSHGSRMALSWNWRLPPIYPTIYCITYIYIYINIYIEPLLQYYTVVPHFQTLNLRILKSWSTQIRISLGLVNITNPLKLSGCSF